MIDEIISLETAKLAKLKGFNIEQGTFYNEGSMWHLQTDSIIRTGEDLIVEAPTQSLLQKWLREKHNIHIEVFLQEDHPYKKFYYRIMKIGQYFSLSYEDYSSQVYEEVMEEALKYTLNLIK